MPNVTPITEVRSFMEAANVAAAITAIGAAPAVSPNLSGIPLAPTAIDGTNTQQIATCAFVLSNAGAGGVGMTPHIVTAAEYAALTVQEQQDPLKMWVIPTVL